MLTKIPSALERRERNEKANKKVLSIVMISVFLSSCAALSEDPKYFAQKGEYSTAGYLAYKHEQYKEALEYSLKALEDTNLSWNGYLQLLLRAKDSLYKIRDEIDPIDCLSYAIKVYKYSHYPKGTVSITTAEAKSVRACPKFS